MKKLLLILIIITFTILPLKGEMVVTLGASYSGPFKIDPIDFRTTWDQPDGIVSFTERNTSLFDGKGGIGFTAGIANFSSYNFGIGVFVSYLKTDFDITNTFDWSWTWYTGTGNSQQNDWATSGTVNAIPLSLNVIYRIMSSNNLRINLSAGPTVYLCSIKLNGHYGFADFLETETQYLVDYFDIDMFTELNKTVFGGNVSIDFEYFISEGMSLFVGGTYYISGKITDQWVTKQGTYTGLLGQLIRTFDEEAIPGYKYSVNISIFTAKAGIRVYL